MKKIMAILIALSFAIPSLYAIGSSPTPKPRKKVDYYAKGYKLVQQLKKQEKAGTLSGYKLKREYGKAKALFRKAPRNADSLNMYAFCLRKTGHYEEAIKYYKIALKKRSKFPEAREYLGEAYIQLAMQQVKLLKSYGNKGKHALEDLTEAFEDALKEAKE